MESIVQRNKSFSVVYTIYDGDRKKQKWETYHSYEVALRQKNSWTYFSNMRKSGRSIVKAPWRNLWKNMWNCTDASIVPVLPTPATNGSFGTIH